MVKPRFGGPGICGHGPPRVGSSARRKPENPRPHCLEGRSKENDTPGKHPEPMTWVTWLPCSDLPALLLAQQDLLVQPRGVNRRNWSSAGTTATVMSPSVFFRAFGRVGRVDGAARLESGVDVEGLAPGADIVVAGGIDRVIDQRLELEGRSGGNPFELELPDVSCRALRVDTAVPTERVDVTTDGDPVSHSHVVVDPDRGWL